MTGGRVIVLGEIGRNFGAGMSGGIAYLYDRTGDVASKLNYGMVGLEELSDEDREFLRATITRHRDYTGSAVAAGVLASWPVEVARFRKVMPGDYKRVLDVIAAAEGEGLDEQATVERIMEAARA
jgi:glutamate synthase (NADPH/NADH) large chain